LKGYDINWAMPSSAIKTNPLYLKYSNTPLGLLIDQKGAIQAVVQALPPSAENAEIISYYSWLVRCIILMTS